MRLKIFYVNAYTSETLRELELTEEETKALSLDIADIIEFHTNFIKQRVRQNIDKIVEEALRSQSRLLSTEDKKAIFKLLLERNIFVANSRDLPVEIKKEIVKKANLQALKTFEGEK